MVTRMLARFGGEKVKGDGQVYPSHRTAAQTMDSEQWHIKHCFALA